MTHSKPVWHREQIKAAVRMTDITLTALAIDNGLPESACRRALLGAHRKGELAISVRIMVPVWELWPDRWRRPRKDGGAPVRVIRRIAVKSRTNPPSRHCQKIGGA